MASNNYVFWTLHVIDWKAEKFSKHDLVLVDKIRLVIESYAITIQVNPVAPAFECTKVRRIFDHLGTFLDVVG